MNPSINEIESVMAEKGHTFFVNDKKNYNLNLIGIRTASNRPNKFDDILCMAWKYLGAWNKIQFSITTDPGLYYLKNPIADTMGTAIVKEGQYRSLWKIDKHKGYKALKQKSNITVIRDFDRDENLDFKLGKEQTGIFGINCHRAGSANRSIEVNKWSAGCQVFADPQDFQVFLRICDQAALNHGNSFSYTLLNEKDFAAT